jgi:hypothetical protein
MSTWLDSRSRTIAIKKMAISPATYDITVQRRADYPLDIEFEDSSGNAMNLTGWQVLAQVWNPNRTQKIGDFSVTIVSAVNGVVQLKLPFSVTAVLPYESRYDVMLVNPSGIREYYLQGVIQASEGYTAP